MGFEDDVEKGGKSSSFSKDKMTLDKAVELREYNPPKHLSIFPRVVCSVIFSFNLLVYYRVFLLVLRFKNMLQEYRYLLNANLG